jgi:phospholipid/cholesterol/gamma-HCH transport system substrate-binding protein
MAEWTRGAKVGVFALACVGAGYALWTFVNPAAGTSGGYTVHAYLNDASGLASFSRVMVAGIPVGNIESIRLDKGKARVDIKVKPDVALYENAELAKRSSSLLGEFVIVIGPGDDSEEKLDDGDEIKRVLEPVTTDQILADLGHVAGRVKSVSDSLAATVGSEQGEEDIRATLSNLAQVTDQLNQTVRENRQSISTIVNNVERISDRSEPQIAQILENVRVITGEVRTLVAEEEGDVKGSVGSLRETMERVNKASLDLQSTMRHINNVSGRIDRGEGTIGRLSKDETLINEVESVVEGVGDYVGGISRLQTIVGLRNDYNFQANSMKSYVELRLQPREDKYYLIELINDPRGLTTVEQTSVDTDNPNDPNHYREIRTVTRNALRFSFQFARRLGPVTGRFGLKESTGGVGLDMHLLQDRFELQQDLFGFGEQITPRWRIALSYEFIRRLWLLTGVDEVVDSNRRDYFIGLQLRFLDEDLKTVLPFAPTSF